MTIASLICPFKLLSSLLPFPDPPPPPPPVATFCATYFPLSLFLSLPLSSFSLSSYEVFTDSIDSFWTMNYNIEMAFLNCTKPTDKMNSTLLCFFIIPKLLWFFKHKYQLWFLFWCICSIRWCISTYSGSSWLTWKTESFHLINISNQGLLYSIV